MHAMTSQSSLPYYETHKFAATLAGQTVQVVSKQGLAHWKEVTPAQRLLAEAVAVKPGEHMVVVDTGPGALASALGLNSPQNELTLIDINAIALEVAPQTLALNKLEHARIHGAMLTAAEQGSYDVAVFEVPQNRKLARRRLVEMYAALRAGGQLYLAGANNEGIQSVIEDARILFGNASVLQYRERNRVARAFKGTHALALPPWASEAGIAPGTWYEFDATITPYSWHLHSLPGVFSYDRVDEGTAFLLAHLDAPRGLRVLDVGCGYGLIGLWAIAGGASSVDMVDVNLLAVASSQHNIVTLGVTHVRAFASDALSAVADQRYDVVVTNPPFHTGKTIDYEAAHTFIAHARTVLVPGGRLVVVANAFIPYERLIGEVFGSVATLARSNRYQVLVAQ
jgi:16S rRNA (guanine1207-N2)-methyltransferase